LLATLAQPSLKPVRLQRNTNRGAARNAGIAVSRGAWIVLLDSDMIVRPDFLAAHARVLEKGAQISLGFYVDTDSLAPAGNRPLPAPWPGPGYFTSANVALERRLLDAVSEEGEGPFDARTFERYGWEDLDLELRLNRLNPVRGRDRRAVSFHICPPFSLDVLDAMTRKEIDRAAMARRFLAKHPRLAVRMLTQKTPFHRAAWELLTVFGLLNARSLRPLLGWLVRHDRHRLASVLARNLILNPTYVRHL
jgi:glycosyltransferase involved in cell wall biosynthesis